MRFLVVYKDYVRDAKNLLAELGISDVQVLACGWEKEPAGDARRQLAHNPGAEVGFVGVNKKYRKAVGKRLGCREAANVATVVSGRATLAAWLRPADVAPPAWAEPDEAFRRAADGQPRLIFAVGALDQANRISELRVPFANRAAAALARYAAAGGTASGGLKQFFAEQGVNFAVGGEIIVTYRLHRRGVAPITKSSQWHLKEGDHTTADDAARVYFHNAGGIVVVLRCGPHPAQDFEVDVYMSDDAPS